MATFIMVHGGMHGGWCWEKLVPVLERSGHTVLAPDLPGSGKDDIAPQEVTLRMTGGFIADLARAQCESVVLVGHSLGGISISEAAEQAPEAVLGLIYIAAILLPDGAMARDNAKSSQGKSTTVSVSADGSVLTADLFASRETFYNGCDPADVDASLARLTPQPTRPMSDPLTLSPERYGSIPRADVESLHDNAHPLPLQRSQQEAMPCDPVFTMDTGHSPFVQAPEELAMHLIAATHVFGAKAA